MQRSGKSVSVRQVGRLLLVGICFALFLAWMISPQAVEAGRHRTVEFLRIDPFVPSSQTTKAPASTESRTSESL